MSIISKVEERIRISEDDVLSSSFRLMDKWEDKYEHKIDKKSIVLKNDTVRFSVTQCENDSLYSIIFKISVELLDKGISHNEPMICSYYFPDFDLLSKIEQKNFFLLFNGLSFSEIYYIQGLQDALAYNLRNKNKINTLRTVLSKDFSSNRVQLAFMVWMISISAYSLDSVHIDRFVDEETYFEEKFERLTNSPEVGFHSLSNLFGMFDNQDSAEKHFYNGSILRPNSVYEFSVFLNNWVFGNKNLTKTFGEVVKEGHVYKAVVDANFDNKWLTYIHSLTINLMDYRVKDLTVEPKDFTNDFDMSFVEVLDHERFNKFFGNLVHLTLFEFLFMRSSFPSYLSSKVSFITKEYLTNFDMELNNRVKKVLEEKIENGVNLDEFDLRLPGSVAVEPKLFLKWLDECEANGHVPWDLWRNLNVEAPIEFETV